VGENSNGKIPNPKGKIPKKKFQIPKPVLPQRDPNVKIPNLSSPGGIPKGKTCSAIAGFQRETCPVLAGFQRKNPKGEIPNPKTFHTRRDAGVMPVIFSGQFP
jgi:hypothetical protein